MKQLRVAYIRGTETERFWPKVEKSLDGCWYWRAALRDDGYGIFRCSDGTNVRAHVWAFETTAGPVPDGLELDHLCRHRDCVNPQHLEAVTHAINASRSVPGKRSWRKNRTHCLNGHDFSVSAYFYRDQRHCRTCISDSQRRARAKKKIHA